MSAPQKTRVVAPCSAQRCAHQSATRSDVDPLRRDPLMRGLSFAAIMGILTLMIHSAADFNLQIPANALTFMLILAFAWISRYHAGANS